MSAEFDDPEEASEMIRGLVLRAMVPVVKKLERVVRGPGGFRDDAERHACLALARLAPALLGDPPPPWSGPGYHPSHTPEQARVLLAKLQASEREWEQRQRRDANGDTGNHNDSDEHVEES